KNHILVESFGSVMGGVGFGVATGIAIFVMATPVGWVAALVIGAGSFASSYAGGKIAKGLYDTLANNKDLTKLPVVSNLCH
ncbi:hypothetical protein MNBD_GAMMA23-1540, partial [hydrothermal vent metagenome]